MTASRRALLKSAAFASLFAGTGAFSACSRSEKSEPVRRAPEAPPPAKLDAGTISEAEKVARLAFTPKERTMMIETLEGALEALAQIRSVEIGNHEAPALQFDPRLPRTKIKSQKNTLILGGSYNSPKPKGEADIAFASIAEQGAWLRSKSISSTELTEIYLKRIGKYDTKLSAFVTVTADLARAQAAAADADIAKGRDRGPLHGIPYSLKDLADTAGIATSWGAEPYRDRVPAEDAEVVRKLKSAGAVLLGKTACGAIAYGDQWFGGVTRNPWNPGEGSSGSSAGSASATAAGLCSFAIGTETLGSIISPSERCGTVGLRPTFGRVSRAGFMALCWSLDKIGPICRTAEDAAIVLSQINGYDADDPGSSRFGFAYDGKMDLKSLTVGYVPKWFEEADEADRAALAAMKSLGVALIEFPWPATDYGVLEHSLLIEAAAAFSDLTLSNRDDELARQDDEAWPNLWRAARLFPAVDYVQIDRMRRRLMAEMATAFEGFDALIGPHYAGGALLASNFAGYPQLAFRSGFAQTSIRNLDDEAKGESAGPTFRTPRGTSLWGGLYQEGKIIALARALEQSLSFASERPPGF